MNLLQNRSKFYSEANIEVNVLNGSEENARNGLKSTFDLSGGKIRRKGRRRIKGGRISLPILVHYVIVFSAISYHIPV